MTAGQIRDLLTATPFRAFELLLTDGRSLPVAQPDLIVSTGDERLVTVYQEPDVVEIVDLALVISIRFHLAELFDDSNVHS